MELTANEAEAYPVAIGGQLKKEEKKERKMTFI